MMQLLIANIVGYAAQMRIRNEKRAESFLPRKSASDPLLVVNMIGRSGFDLADKSEERCWVSGRAEYACDRTLQ